MASATVCHNESSATVYSIVYGEESSVIEYEVLRVRSLLYELVLEYQGSMEGMATTDEASTA
jgi:hypothetical protein